MGIYLLPSKYRTQVGRGLVMARLSTVKAIEAAKPKSKEYKLTVDRDLYLRIAPSGAKTWLVRYVVGGKQRQFTLPKPYGAIQLSE